MTRDELTLLMTQSTAGSQEFLEKGWEIMQDAVKDAKPGSPQMQSMLSLAQFQIHIAGVKAMQEMTVQLVQSNLLRSKPE